MLRKTAMLIFVGAVLGIIVLAGCRIPLGGKVSSSSGSSAASPTTATGILSNLGVKEVSSPPAATITDQTSSGETTVSVDPSTWQPLKKKYSVFAPQAEIFQAGGSSGTPVQAGSTPSYGDGTIWNSFYENSNSSYNMTAPVIGTSADQSWEQSAAKISVAADLTGDGLDNIVVFYVNKTDPGTLNDIVYSAKLGSPQHGAFGGSQVVTGVPLTTTSGDTVFDHWEASGRSGIGTPWFPYFSCTKADLDGNGIDEILLADYETLYELSVDPSGAVTVVKYIQESSPISSVAAGDYNGSGKDDVVVGLQGDTWILYTSGLVEVDPYQAGGTTNSPVEATFGNFEVTDGGGEELAVCAQATDGNILVTMYDFTAANGNPLSRTSFEDNLNPFEANANTSYDYYRMLPRAIDITGTGTDALSVLGSIYEQPFLLNETSSKTPPATYAAGTYSSATSPTNPAATYPNPNDNTVVDMEAGNVSYGGLGQSDQSGQTANDPTKQDLIVLSVGENSEHSVPDINVFGLNGSNQFVCLEEILESNNASSLASIGQYGTSTTMAVGNFEDNAPRVEYVGHTLTFTNPVVIAALASPPYWSDIANSDPGYANAYTGWNTTFGETQANEQGTSTSVDFSVGAEVKYEDDVDIFGIEAASFESSVSFTNTNSWEYEHSIAVEKSIQYNCPGGENLVIFTSVPMDQYQYQVLSTDDPTNSPVGSSLYIVIPRTFSTYVVTQAFFNSHINPSIIQPISNSVFGRNNFTIGDPTTYPSSSLEASLMSNAFGALGWSDESDYQIGEQHVAEGTNNISGGSTNLQITMTSTSAETISHDFEMDTSVGGGAGGLSVLANAGFQTGYSTSSESSTSTSYGGTVGYLPDTYYSNAKYDYSAGLFVYPYKQPNGTTFWVVDYDVN